MAESEIWKWKFWFIYLFSESYYYIYSFILNSCIFVIILFLFYHTLKTFIYSDMFWWGSWPIPRTHCHTTFTTRTWLWMSCKCVYRVLDMFLRTICCLRICSDGHLREWCPSGECTWFSGWVLWPSLYNWGTSSFREHIQKKQIKTATYMIKYWFIFLNE